MFSRPSFLLAAAVLAAALAGTSAADFTVSVTFADGGEFAAAELAARVTACAAIGTTVAESDKKIECVRFLIDTSATCVEADATTSAYCIIGGVQVPLNTLEFECDGGSFDGTPETGCLAIDAHYDKFGTAVNTCSAVDGTPATNGGYDGDCYSSAYCAFKASVAVFGSYCPAAGAAATCCGLNIKVNPTVFSGGTTMGGADHSVATLRTEMDHVVDLDIDVTYDITSPTRLKIMVNVPYITSTSTVAYAGVNYTVCPSTYLIDFKDPIEYVPDGDLSGIRDGSLIHSGWLPLTHALTEALNYDLVGKPRSSCANLDFTWNPSPSASVPFGYPSDPSDPSSTVNYATGSLMEVDPTVFGLGADAYQPVGTMWSSGIDAVTSGRFWYNTSSHLDIVNAYYQCKTYSDGTKVVGREVESEGSIVNGVEYPVETYSWEMKVCQVGYFGPECDSHNPGASGSVSTYAKACKRVPAAFSLSPQMISTASVSPVDSNLVTKSFLHSVRGVTSDCEAGFERYVTVLQLMYFSLAHDIHESPEHDLNEPVGVFESPVDQKNFDVLPTAVGGVPEPTTVDDFLTWFAGQSGGEGVYRFSRTEFTISGEQMVRQKFAVVSKCLFTGYDQTTKTRSTPGAFGDTYGDADGNVHVDFELVLKRTDTSTGLAQNTINTVNLRVLATKESFELSSEFVLQQASMKATQYLYGELKSAAADNALAVSMNASTITRRPNDQVCSKHQLDADFAASANLEPNAVGACMLKTPPAGSVVHPGKTIRWRIIGQSQEFSFTYGCRLGLEDSWIDTGASTKEGEVYLFEGQPTRLPFGDTHEKVFWLVAKGKPNTESLNAEFTMAERFGVGMFYYNTTANAYANVYEPGMQVDADERAGLDLLGAGCSNTGGHMKSACNLVCFDLVRNLLSDEGGNQEVQVVVHHISVAVVVDESQGATGNRFSRKLLLETAVARETGGESSGAAALRVAEPHSTTTGAVEAGASSDAAAPALGAAPSNSTPLSSPPPSPPSPPPSPSPPPHEHQHSDLGANGQALYGSMGAVTILLIIVVIIIVANPKGREKAAQRLMKNARYESRDH